MVAPDHLLSGLSINVTDAMFATLPEDVRDIADVQIVSALKNNGLLKQRQVYNSRKKAVNSMSLSAVFCVVTVSAQIFDILLPSKTAVMGQVLQLLTSLQKLITYTYWWPRGHIDGSTATDFITGRGKDDYCKELQIRAKQYVRDVNKVCADHPEYKKYLDKPNVHRLLELYHHTVPIVGHVREVMELVFEHAHQPLKRCIAHSNHHHAELAAVVHCLANDWQGRIASLRNEWDAEEESLRRTARRGIRRMLLGPVANSLDDEIDHALTEEIDKQLLEQFSRPLMTLFDQQALVSRFASACISVWNAVSVLKENLVIPEVLLAEGETLQSILSHGEILLADMHPTMKEDGVYPGEVQFVADARRSRENVIGAKLRCQLGSHEQIRPQCAIQIRAAMRTDGEVLVDAVEDGSTTKIFAVISLAMIRSEDVYALFARCSVSRGGELKIRGPIGKKSAQWIRLTDSVRRVALYHDCHSEGSTSCVVDRIRRNVKHSGSLLSGALMRFQGRADGFPPRMG